MLDLDRDETRSMADRQQHPWQSLAGARQNVDSWRAS
jgi:hypothetical protein